MQDFQIYLAGGMGKFGKDRFFESNNWRKYCKNTLENYDTNRYKVHVINPNDYFNFADETPRYASQKEVMELDLNRVRRSDLVIINFNDMYSLGSMSELAIAYDRRIPVIGVDTSEQNLHQWQIEMCQRIFNSLDLMLDYVEDYYLTWERRWMKDTFKWNYKKSFFSEWIKKQTRWLHYSNNWRKRICNRKC